MNLTKHAGATLAVAAMVLGTAGVAAAATDAPRTTRPLRTVSSPAGTESASTERVAGPAVAAARKRLLTDAQRTQLRTTGHVEVVKQTPKRGPVTVLVQRGEITAVSATSITVKSQDGYTHSYAIGARTKIRERRAPVAISELKVGERAVVMARRTDAGDVARLVNGIGAGQAGKAGKGKRRG